MGNNHTTHYELNQWTGEDTFLRTDFNEDNRKTDTALNGLNARLRTLERGIQPISYHLYQLLLRDYYAGKDLVGRRALFYDGFLDRTRIAEQSQALLYDPGAVYLTRNTQAPIREAYSTGDVSVEQTLKTQIYTVDTFCLVTGFTLHWWIPGSQGSGTARVYLQVNGKSVATSAELQKSGPVTTVQESTLNFSTPVLLRPGDQVQVTSGGIRPIRLFLDTSGSGLGGSLEFTTLSGTVANLRSVPIGIVKTFDRALAWVRHSGGEVEVSLLPQEGEALKLTRIERRETVNLQGEPCVEDAYLLDCPGKDGAGISTRLDLALGCDPHMVVFDYGVALQ